MKIEDCEVGMKVNYNSSDDRGIYTITAVGETSVLMKLSGGVEYVSSPSNLQPVKRKRWINIYGNSNSYVRYDTEQAAIAGRLDGETHLGGGKYITTICVEY